MSSRHYLLCLAVVGSALFGVYLLNHGRASKSGESVEPAQPKKVLVWYGYVDLRHGPTSLYPSRPGRVSSVLVQENDEVSKGAPLLTLDDALAQLQVQEAKTALEIAGKQLLKAEKLPEVFRAKVAQQQSAIAAFDYRLLAAEAVIASENQIKEVKALRTLEMEKLAELKLTDPVLEVDIARKQVERVRLQLAQAQKALQECTLAAPAAGTVMRILVNPGEVLGLPARQPALIFAPRGPRIVRAEVEQEFAGRVQVGQQVRVEDDTDVVPLGTGKVTSVSNWFLPRRLPLEDPRRFNSGRTLECIITLDAGQEKLRIGQRVRIRLGP